MSDKGGTRWTAALRRLARTQPAATVAALMVGGFFIGATQNLMAPNLSAVAAAFGLSPAEKDLVLGGWMSSAFFIVGAPMSILFGILADRSHRVQLFVLMCAVAGVISAGTGAAFAVYQLLLLRACLGAVYGALNPVLFSMVGDMFPASERPAMASYFSLATGGGTAVGQMAAGILSRFGWRLPFFIVAVGCALACAVLLTVGVEPVRGAIDGAAAGAAGTAVTSPAAAAAASSSGGSASASASATGLSSPAPGIKHRHVTGAATSDDAASAASLNGASADISAGSSASALAPPSSSGKAGGKGKATAASGSSTASSGRNISPNTLERGGAGTGSGAGTAADGAGTGSGAAATSAVGPASPEKAPLLPSVAGASGAASDSDSASANPSAATSGSVGGGGGGSMSMSMLAELRSSLGSLRSQLRRVLAVPSNRLVFAQALFGTIPWSVITVYLPDYLAAEQGFSVPGATLLVLLFGIGAIVGGVVGGKAGGALYKRNPRLVPLAFGATQAASALPMLWLVNAKLQTSASADEGGKAGGSSVAWPVFPVGIAAGLLASLTGPNLKAILMNSNPPQLRGAVFTFAYLFDSISKGIAPALIGYAVSRVGSRQAVFSVALLGWVGSGAIIAAMTRTVVRDEADAHARARVGGGVGTSAAAASKD